MANCGGQMTQSRGQGQRTETGADNIHQHGLPALAASFWGSLTAGMKSEWERFEATVPTRTRHPLFILAAVVAVIWVLAIADRLSR